MIRALGYVRVISTSTHLMDTINKAHEVTVVGTSLLYPYKRAQVSLHVQITGFVRGVRLMYVNVVRVGLVTTVHSFLVFFYKY